MDVKQQWWRGLGYLLNLWQDNLDLTWLKTQDYFCFQSLQKWLGFYGYGIEKKSYHRLELYNLLNPVLILTEKQEGVLVISTNHHQICCKTHEKSTIWVSWDEFEAISPKYLIQVFKLSFPQISVGMSLQIIKMAWHKFSTVPRFTMMFSILLISYELFSLIEPVLLNFLIENLDVFGNRFELLIFFIFVFLLLILGLFIGLFRQKLWIFVLGKISNFLSDELMLSFLARPITQQSKQPLRDDLSKINLNEQIFYRLLQQVFYSSMDILFLCIHFVVMCLYNFSFAIIDLFFLCFIGVMNYYAAKKYFSLSEKVLEKQSKYTGSLVELLKQLSIIKLFSIEQVFFYKWQSARHQYWENFLAHDWFGARLEWLGVVLKKTNWMLTVGISMYLVLSQKLSLGALIAYLTLKGQVFLRFEAGLKRLMQWQYLKVPLNRMSTLFKQDSLIENQFNHLMAINSQSLIETRDLKVHGIKFFDLVLLDLQKYFLKGISGAGKTSLIKAIMGLLPLESGSVFYKGKNCANDKFLSLQRDCVLVQQDEELFDAGLIENITLFDECIDEERLKTVLQLLELTDVGKDAGQLSSGQKQRVFLARALYRKPRCLILDEATCHLDGDAELKILHRLLALPIMMIVVNHRHGLESLFDQVILQD